MIMLLYFLILPLLSFCFYKIKKKLLDDKQKELCDVVDASIDGTVDGTIGKLFAIFEHTDKDTRQCIIDFFEKNQSEHLRKKVMELICKIKASTNNDEKFIHVKSSNIIHQILLELEAYVTTQDEQFKVDFIYGKVSKEIYEECMKIVVEQDITECSEAVDYLFSIRNPESRARCITICVNVKKLLEKEGSCDNGNKWIEIFGMDVNKYNSKNGYYVEATDDIWQELVRYTVNQLQKLDTIHSSSIEGACKLITEFFQKCVKKPLKISTMELLCKVSEEIKSKGSIFVHEVLLQIVLQYEIYSNGKDDAESDLHQYVPEKLQNSCIEVVKVLDITKCSSALDLLLCLSKPVSDYREIFVADFVQNLLKYEKTFINGVKWTFIFDLAYVKIFEFQNIVYKTYNFQKEDEVLPLILSSEKNWYLWVLQTSLHRAESEKFESDVEEKFVKYITVKKLRSLIEKEDCSAAAPRYPEKQKLDCYCKRNNAGQKENKTLKPDLDRAFLLLDNKDTFKDAIKIISKYKFAELDIKYATKIVCKALIFSNKKSVPKDILKTQEDKIHLMLILETFYQAVVRKKLQTEEEEELSKLFTFDELPYIVPTFARKYKAEVLVGTFFSYQSLLILSMQKIYERWSHNIFGFCYMHVLEDGNENRELNFRQIFVNDRRYTHSWLEYMDGYRLYKKTKELTIEEQAEQVSENPANIIEKFPIFLQNKDDFKRSALEWENKIYADIDIHPFCANEDSIIECIFLKKNYKFISIKSSKALNAFIDEYLSKIKLVGIDCETGDLKDLVTVLQLKSEEWFCLIDVQEIRKEMKKDYLLDDYPLNDYPIWKKLFEQLFDPSITRIGFAFENDFSYLAYTFPWLKDDLLQKDESKVLCLQKLTNHILKCHKLKGFFSPSSNIKDTCSLAKLSKEVLELEMDKMEQGSDWTQRPLTPLQKIYAVLDALIVVLIYDKLQLRLKEKLGDASTAAEILKNGYMCYVLK